MKIPSILYFLALLFSVTLFPSFGHSGGWLIHHVGSFKGKVIDAETKEPIAGAVVVAKYHIRQLGPVGFRTDLIDVQETLTNQEGEFYIPSFIKGINPLSVGYDTSFLIWKPTYKEEEIWGDYFFSKEPGMLEERSVQTPKGFVMKKVKLGFVEIARLKTKEERLRNIPNLPSQTIGLENLKNFIRLINEEERALGLKESDPYMVREFILRKMGGENR